MLTDAEIKAIGEGNQGTWQDDLQFARAIEAKVLAKLREQEPSAYEVTFVGKNPYGFPSKSLVYTGDSRLIANSDNHQVTGNLYKHPAPIPEGWISVEDRLPEPEQSVLIFINGSVRLGERRWEYPGFEDTFKAYWYWDDPEDDGKEWERDDVTHWMPLPQPPMAAARSGE